jgi:APA family basic amino acid/polyamine antiporter
MTDAAQLAVAVGVTLAVSALNFVGVRFGAAANNLTAAVKVLALVAFAVLGPLIGTGDTANLRPLVTGATQLTLSAFALAMSPVLFSYLGWNSSVYVASEIRDPARNLPRSLFAGVAICTSVYLLVNAVYLYAIPVDLLRNEANAGEGAARALFGGPGGAAVAVFVLISILGTLNASVLVGPRIAYAMALDGLFMRGVDRAHPRYRTPSGAIVLQALVSVGILLIFEDFRRALDYTVFAILLATMADVAALYALRRFQPDRRRPYRAWGYPWVPALYFFANAGVAGTLLVENPGDCAIGLAFVAAGVPFYLLFSRRPPPHSSG